MTYQTLTFGDSALDPKVWTVYDGPGNAGIGLRRPSAVTVVDNVLTLTGTMADEVTGGLRHNVPRLFGEWSVRARVDAGTGWWPCLGLWPESENPAADGEVDFCEMPAGDRSVAYHTLHYGPDGSRLQQTSSVNGVGWHTYGVTWASSRLGFRVDGVETFAVTDPDLIPQKPMHLFMQLDQGPVGGWVASPDMTSPEAVSLFIAWARF